MFNLYEVKQMLFYFSIRHHFFFVPLRLSTLIGVEQGINSCIVAFYPLFLRSDPSNLPG